MANVDDFASLIIRQLQAYSRTTNEIVDKQAKIAAQEAVKELKVTSPKRPQGGKYAKAWTFKKVNGSYYVYNKDFARLTSILEKGHAKRNGGRTAAQVHIRTAEQNAIRNFIDGVERNVSQ